MKLFQRFRRRELTPEERLADYESEIAYNQSNIENLSVAIKNYQSLFDIYSKQVNEHGFSKTSLNKTLKNLDDCYEDINNAKSNLQYYKVLRDHLKKELESQNS